MTPIKYSALVEALGDLNSSGEEHNSTKSDKVRDQQLTPIDKVPGW